MDYSSTLKVHAEQAVFTSARSAMGEGYRLIAASSGITTPERMEITRHCPSHNALCDETPGTVGLLAFPLTTGKYAVGYTCFAGAEQTGRGGYRVYTHLALLSPSDFAAADFDPVTIHRAIAQTIGETRILHAVPRLEPLELAIPSSSPNCSRQVETLCHILGSILGNRRMVVNDLPSALDTLSSLLRALPASHRKTLSITAGIKFAINRHIQLSIISHDLASTKRAIAGLGIVWMDCSATLPAVNFKPGGWLDYVRTIFTAGNFYRVSDLSRTINFPIAIAGLDRIAALCFDLDAIGSAYKDLLARIMGKYGTFQPANPVESNLLLKLRTLANTRRDFLTRSEEPEPVSHA